MRRVGWWSAPMTLPVRSKKLAGACCVRRSIFPWRLAVVADPFGNTLVLLDLSKGRYVTDSAGPVGHTRPHADPQDRADLALADRRHRGLAPSRSDPGAGLSNALDRRGGETGRSTRRLPSHRRPRRIPTRAPREQMPRTGLQFK